MQNSDKPAILFIPEAGIYPFVRGLAVLGDAIKKQGTEVLITRCTGQMIRCPLMAMKKFPLNATKAQKESLCTICAKRLNCVKQKYKFQIINLADFVNEELIKEIDNALNSSYDDLEKIVFRGFPVGQIAQYDFILETKFPYSKNLSPEHKAIYAVYVKNTALAIAVTDELCKKYNPSLLITFNEYAQCQGVRYSAEKRRVARRAMTYPVHFNVDSSRFSIWRSTCEFWRYRHCQNWNEGKNIPISPENVFECWKDALFRMFRVGSHIFSARKNSDPAVIFKKLGLKANRKTIVVYTSSQDERGSVEIAMKIWSEDNGVKDAFKNQIEWLSVLREYAKHRNDVQIVVRIHPREGHRQFRFDSQHLILLKEKFKKNTDNFFIVWPDNPISSYDLMELANVCLVPWTLMGQECARVGIPVLTYTGNMFYPDDDFMQVAVDKEQYFKKLDGIIEMDYTRSHLLKAIRFYHWRIFLPSLDLSETVPNDFNAVNFWPFAPPSMIPVINEILMGDEDVIRFNIEKWKKSLSDDAEKKEKEAFEKAIRFFIDAIFYPPSNLKITIGQYIEIFKKIWYRHIGSFTYKKRDNLKFKDYLLEFSEDASRTEKFRARTEKNKRLRILVVDGLYAVLIHNGKIFRRMSPMIVKLARLHHESQTADKLNTHV